MKEKSLCIIVLLLATFGSIPQGLAQSFADHFSYVGPVIQEPGYHVWGSSPVIGDDGKYYLFAARWKKENRFDPGWRSSSEIAQYVCDSPTGSFKFVRTILKGTGKNTWDKYGIHNPTIHKIGSKYVLLYISNNDWHEPPHPANQCTGMMIADNVNGTFKKIGTDGMLLAPSTDPSNWSYKGRNGIANPALLQRPDGKFLIYFKTSGKMGVALADKVDGPYKIYDKPVTQNNQAIEDGYAFMYKGKVCLLTTDNWGIIEKGGGILWTSDDGGLTFNHREQGFHLFQDYLTQAQIEQTRKIYGPQIKFERPQLLLINDKPAYLYVPSGANIFGGDVTCSFVLKFSDN